MPSVLKPQLRPMTCYFIPISKELNLKSKLEGIQLWF